MTEEGPRNKADLMERIGISWDELMRLIGALTLEELEQPLVDGWSAKVHLGHISVWEASLLALLRGESRQAAMGAPVDAWERHDTDAINARWLNGRNAGRWTTCSNAPPRSMGKSWRSWTA